MVIKSDRKKKKELNNFCLTKYFPLPFISDPYLCVKTEDDLTEQTVRSRVQRSQTSDNS